MKIGVKGYLALLAFWGSAVLFGGCAVEELTARVWKNTYWEPESGWEDRDREPLSERKIQEDIQVAQERSLLTKEAGHYAYDCLTQAQQLWYRDIEKSLGSMAEFTRLSEEGLSEGLDEDCIDTVFQCVMNDHPEIFYVEGYSYSKYTRGDKVVAIAFSGSYSMDWQEAVLRQEAIEAEAEALLTGAEDCESEYDKVKYVYETLIRNTDYDLEAEENQNIYSVLVNRSSVCLGYAKATQYLLNRLGVECTLVQGTVDTGEGHAWNLVKVDGEYYYVDTTWGDASYQSLEGLQETEPYRPSINYDYLCVTTKQLLCTHTLDCVVPMPECTAMAANYYVREEAFFTDYDRGQMERLFARAGERGWPDVTVKCADRECFELILEAMIDGQEIFSYLDAEETVAYACNDKQMSITFWTVK